MNKTLKLIVLAVLTINYLTACNNSKKSSTKTAVSSCPTGTVLTNGYCYYPNGQVVNPNYTTNGVAEFAAANYGRGGLSISNSSVYREFLKNVLQVCDQWSYSVGAQSCNTWDNGPIAVVYQATSGNQGTLHFVHYGPTGWDTMFSGGFGFNTSTGSFPHLAVQMAVSPINNNLGFEARGYGSYYTMGGTQLIQFIVENGKIQDGYYNYKIALGSRQTGVGTVFFEGQMIRCQTPGCVNW